MKKIIAAFMALTLLFSLAACGKTKPDGGISPSPKQSGASDSEKNDGSPSSATDLRSLVVYFSWSGNTENVAKSIREQTNSEIFEIVPAVPYSEDYDTVVDFAQQEQRSEARPAIASRIKNIGDYDVIFVGYPNWWGDMPMILYTFFDSYDLSGKTIAPFCTSGGSGLSDTVNSIKKLELDATVTKGIHIGSGSSSKPDEAVGEWLESINLK